MRIGFFIIFLVTVFFVSSIKPTHCSPALDGQQIADSCHSNLKTNDDSSESHKTEGSSSFCHSGLCVHIFAFTGEANLTFSSIIVQHNSLFVSFYISPPSKNLKRPPIA